MLLLFLLLMMMCSEQDERITSLDCADAPEEAHFYQAVTSILSKPLLHKMMNSRQFS